MEVVVGEHPAAAAVKVASAAIAVAAPVAASAVARSGPGENKPCWAALVSQCTVRPCRPSVLPLLKLSVSDMPMLSCHYIQKGLLYPQPPASAATLVPLLRLSLSRALAHFPALAGRLVTDPTDGRIFVSCNDAGVPFSFYSAAATGCPLGPTLPEILNSRTPSGDVPAEVRDLFDAEGAVSYEGHHRPIASVRVTELVDGAVFIACAANHAVVDGTSFWNFFNSWAEIARHAAPGGDSGRGGSSASISRAPDFRRDFFGESTAVIRFAGGKGPEVTFDAGAPLRERIFRFSAAAIRDLKSMANGYGSRDDDNKVVQFRNPADDLALPISELQGKLAHDKRPQNTAEDISSFQSLCALLWKHVTRARIPNLPADATSTTFRMAVNCRQRVSPPVSPYYFGNAIQSIPTSASLADVAGRDLGWAAGLLRANVAAYGDAEVRRVAEEWERAPRCFPLGNPQGTGLTMGSSPRFPMYDNDFGWGSPVAVRSGRANKFDGKMSAFPGTDGAGSVDVEVCLAPATMAALLADGEFMAYVLQEEIPC